MIVVWEVALPTIAAPEEKPGRSQLSLQRRHLLHLGEGRAAELAPGILTVYSEKQQPAGAGHASELGQPGVLVSLVQVGQHAKAEDQVEEAVTERQRRQVVVDPNIHVG